MSEVIICGSAAALLFLASVIMFIVAIATKKVKLALWALVPFMLAGIVGAYAAYAAVTKAYKHISEELKARSGTEIYNALLGVPNGCVEVEHSVDQLVPRMDPAIFLQCRLCSEEVERLLKAEDYTMTMEAWNNSAPGFPEEFDLTMTGDSVMVFDKMFDANHSRTIIISRDSTKMLMADWAD